jgi:alpha-mannosidase
MKPMTTALITSIAALATLGPVSAHCRSIEIFAIGKKNGSFTDFAREHDPAHPVVYKVAESSPQKDWPAYQPGSFDPIVGRSTMQQDWVNTKPGPKPQPFKVQFNLSTAPKGTFVLHLDAIFRYRRPAPPLYTIFINGKLEASYRLTPHPAPELWWPNGGEAEGNTQYFGYQSLDMEMPASLFVAGANAISMECIDGFGIYYDRLAFFNDPDKSPRGLIGASVEPTVFYKNRPTGLVELAILRFRTTRPMKKVKLTAVIGSTRVATEVTQTELGDIDTIVEVPALDKPAPVALYIGDRTAPVYRGIFTPRRRWQVYALPMEQADFGYNDLPARTLEWENRFIDTALQIQHDHSSYSFTLDAAANLDSYLATRDEEHAKQLLEYLRNGKWGINALYTNFFTGLASPEELYRTLEFSLEAGRRHGFIVDSASQTDEPSITWALPQVLADAGIKYFTNGSDPIRGAMNPIGHLNFLSPFRWEAPNGAKVLVWSGVSYTAVDDMTWGGWNPESAQSGTYKASIFGLTRSLPLFLSQYDRDDFPFDAVLLFGLHNDEIPLRHSGDADVMEIWNREYAYPKIMPATQRDFFNHITANFDDKIKTYSGDGGAYWEDEAGADARIAAMIRTAQSQLVAAETFESIANWLQPHLKLDRQSFASAWKNILLADSYVWSDANSFRRPESYRTRGGEAAHRAWAEDAFQQTSDLKLVAMDKISELVHTDRQGVVVFNAESWPRSDLFDFELEPDESLVDPATDNAIPCGVTKEFKDYRDVRCWASDVPATGYKFYAIAKGTVPKGEVLSVDRSAPRVENQYYQLQLDPQTGAIAQLIDKGTGKDLVNQHSEFRLNEYLYVSGGDPGNLISGSLKDNRILTDDMTLPLPELRINRSTLTRAPQAIRFPWGVVLTTNSQALNTPEITSDITLFDTRKQINIQNDVAKLATLKKEGVYFAFPFALERPQMSYQGTTAWVNPETDMLPGANRQWFTTQGGVWAKGSDNSVAWATADAPLITLQDINRGLWPESIQIRNGTLFSYAMNNYWYTDTPAQQGGHFVLRYALTSGPALSASQALTLSSDQRSPLTAIRRYQMGWPGSLSDKGTGFLEASPSGVTVLTVRPLEKRDTYLVRVQNSTPNDVTATLQFPTIKLQDSYLGSVMGDRIAPVKSTVHTVTLAMQRYEIKSLVVKISNQ